jgi:hypothetical protein
MKWPISIRGLLGLSVTSTVLIASSQARDAGQVVMTGTAQISGAVLSSDAQPAPVRRATMTLSGDRSGLRLVAVTDESGQFAFPSLPPDRYTILATKGGYLPMRYGSKRPGGSGTPVVVAEGQRVAIAMTLIKGSVLTGTVRDALGAPLPDVTVTALRYAVSQLTGERGPLAATIGSSFAFPGYNPDDFPGTASTDDRGVYRIYGLAPGEYVVSASVRPPRGASPLVSTDIHQVSLADVRRAQQLLRGSSSGMLVNASPGGNGPVDTSRVDFAPVYHPAAIAAAEATIITLGQSEQRSDVDVLVRLVPTARITGTASQPDGSPVSGAQISVMEPGSSLPRAMRVTRSTGDGTFAIAGVNPGRYVVTGIHVDGLSGAADVEVAGHDVSTSIVFSPGVTVSGRIVFDGVSKAPGVNAVRLILWPPPFGGFRFAIEPDGRFAMSQVPPGKYQLQINGRPPVGWLLRSVMVNGVDASDIAFDVKPNENVEGAVITLTDRGGEISGRFIDAVGKPAPEYVLVVFSADRQFWVPRTRRTQQVRPDVNGVFVARDLPAGDYLISAVTDLEDGQWHDPAFLAALAANSPIRISLAEGDKKVQDIRVGGR